MKAFILEAFYGGNQSECWAFTTPQGAAEWMLVFPRHVFDCRFELTEREVCDSCRQIVVEGRAIDLFERGQLPNPFPEADR